MRVNLIFQAYMYINCFVSFKNPSLTSGWQFQKSLPPHQKSILPPKKVFFKTVMDISNCTMKICGFASCWLCEEPNILNRNNSILSPVKHVNLRNAIGEDLHSAYFILLLSVHIAIAIYTFRNVFIAIYVKLIQRKLLIPYRWH